MSHGFSYRIFLTLIFNIVHSPLLPLIYEHSFEVHKSFGSNGNHKLFNNVR